MTSVAPYDDDDDWVGEPPEGRHTREQSNPGFWATQWKGSAISGGVIALLIIVVVLILVLR
jgi:hypothetical protein